MTTVHSYETHYALCETCRWKGPMRYSLNEAQADMDGHDKLRHVDGILDVSFFESFFASDGL